MRRLNRLLFSLVAALCLSACGMTQTTQAPTIDVSIVEWPLEATQALTVKRGDQSKSLLVALRYSDEQLTMDFVSVSGVRLATLTASTAMIQLEKHVPVPLNIEAERVLRDLLMVYANKADVAALAAVLSVEDQSNFRKVTTPDEVITIEYSRLAAPWSSSIEFNNEKLDYQLSIRTLQLKTADASQ